MNAEIVCSSCGATVSGAAVYCTCGSVVQRGGNILPLVAWIFVPLVIPLYPIAGAFASLALVVSSLLVDFIGPVGFVLVPIAVYVTLFATFKLEQRASQRAGYRVFRNVTRLALAGVVSYWAVTRAGSTLSPANALFILIVAVPAGWWLLKQLDKVFRAAGPRKATQREIAAGAPEVITDDTPVPSRAGEFWHPLNHPFALMLGFGAAVLFSLTGGFNLFAGLLAWIAVTGGIMCTKALLRLGGKAASVASEGSAKLGGVPTAMVVGGGGGAILGAILGQTIDGHVEAAHFIIVGVVGVIVALVVNGFRRRRRARA